MEKFENGNRRDNLNFKKRRRAKQNGELKGGGKKATSLEVPSAFIYYHLRKCAAAVKLVLASSTFSDLAALQQPQRVQLHCQL